MGELGLKRTTRFAAALGAGAGLILLNGIGFASENLQNLCWAALASSIALAGLTWAMAAGISAPLPELLQIRTPRRPLSAGGIALAVAGMLALSHASSLALARAGLLEGGALARFDGLLAAASGGELLWAAFALAVAPALAEETLFRGLLRGRFAARLGAARGLLLSSLLFGAIHLDFGQGLAALVLGLYLGTLTLRTGSIHAAVLCHGVNNLAAIFSAYFRT